MRALLFLACALVAVTVHEWAHARAALHVGDYTARIFGRLSLNPLVHLHPLWSIALPLATAWASGGQWVVAGGRPVPIDRTIPREDRFLVYGAGIAANLALGLVAHGLGLTTLAEVNATMALTNLVPLPGLDGWHLARTLLARRRR